MQWWLLAYLGVIASGVCFFLWNYGARRVTPVKLAIMNNLKIPLAALISLLLFREQPNMFLLALWVPAYPVLFPDRCPFLPRRLRGNRLRRPGSGITHPCHFRPRQFPDSPFMLQERHDTSHPFHFEPEME